MWGRRRFLCRRGQRTITPTKHIVLCGQPRISRNAAFACYAMVSAVPYGSQMLLAAYQRRLESTRGTLLCART